MVHMRFDRRRTPLLRVWSMMRTGVMKNKPAWYDACSMFPPSASIVEGTKDPPVLRYLQDNLLDEFHDQFQRKHGVPYQGVNHLVGTKNKKRERRTYRDVFVEKQAKLLKSSPGMDRETSFDCISEDEEMQQMFRAERNKLAMMTRWALDSKCANLDASLAEVQQLSELKAISKEFKKLRMQVRASRIKFSNYKKASGIDLEVEEQFGE